VRVGSWRSIESNILHYSTLAAALEYQMRCYEVVIAGTDLRHIMARLKEAALQQQSANQVGDVVKPFDFQEECRDYSPTCSLQVSGGTVAGNKGRTSE